MVVVVSSSELYSVIAVGIVSRDSTVYVIRPSRVSVKSITELGVCVEISRDAALLLSRDPGISSLLLE